MKALNVYLKEVKGNKMLIEMLEEFTQTYSFEYYVCPDASKNIESLTDIIRIDLTQIGSQDRVEYKENLVEVLKDIFNSTMYDMDSLKEAYSGIDYFEQVNKRDFLIMCIDYCKKII